MIELQLVIPEDLYKKWLHHRVRSGKFYKRGVSQALLFKLSFCLFLFSLSSICSLSQYFILPSLTSPSLSTIPSHSSDQLFVLLR